MFKKFSFSVLLFFFVAQHLVHAQGKSDAFTNYLCREWKLRTVSMNDKDTSLSKKQEDSRAIFKKDHTFETTTDGETQIKTWRYDAKKETISLKDSRSGQMLYLKIVEKTDEMLAVSFVTKKKLYKLELVPAALEN